jgi:hypothetical protein
VRCAQGGMLLIKTSGDAFQPKVVPSAFLTYAEAIGSQEGRRDPQREA